MNIALLLAAVLSLNGEWKLDYWPQPDGGAVRTLPVPAGLDVKSVRATVPGNCELDLINAGLLPPIEVGLNALELQKYEGHQWLYARTFEKPAVPAGGRVTLRFEGIDTLADVFLNGEKLGETANMLVPHTFDVTDRLKDGANTLQVLIRSAMLEYRGMHELETTGGTCCPGLRKAAYMGGWDIFPRAYVSGLWRDVALDVDGPVSIDDTAWIVKDIRGKWVDFAARCRVRSPFGLLRHANVRYSLFRNGKTAFERIARLNEFHCHAFGLGSDRLALWWPKGMGDQPLYDAKIEVIGDDGRVLAEHVEKIGIRTIKLEMSDVYGPDRPGTFLVRVNGEPCYIRGSNWVPLDPFPSRQAAKIVPTLKMWTDLNCNMVRVWGGGVYEPAAFFDYCDANGILVWQDFMTACDVFPQDDAYAKETEAEVKKIVRRYRNRASLAIWSGNNENDNSFSWRLGKLSPNPNRDRTSRRTIPDALFCEDVSRPYVPSSPYESPDVVAGKAQPCEMHLWGARAYYKVPFYTNSPCWFASEMGYHGCPNRASLEKMMTKDCVYPWKGGPKGFVRDDGKRRFNEGVPELEWNDEWQLKAHNCYLDRKSWLWRRNNLMTNQIRLMFGGVDTDFDTFVEQSQFIQAEAMKTFCELFRSRKFTRFNGLIWWNVQDGCAQISDAVVDYYGGKKPAYAALKNAQYDQIVCVVDDERAAWAVNDARRAVKGHAKLTDAATGRTFLEKDFEIPANGKLKLGTVDFSGQGVVRIEATLDGKPFRNHFLYGAPPFDWKNVKAWMSAAK